MIHMATWAEDHEPGVIANLDKFLDVVNAMTEGPLDHFTCREVEALADLMAAQRGEEAGTDVIVQHLWDEGEEHDELAAHLERWPLLRAALRAQLSDDCPVIDMLRELEEDGR